MKLRVMGAVLAATLALCALAWAQQIAAIAALRPTAGNTTAGTVTFTQTGDKVAINANVSGLAPGPHGFHIHEKGDCSAADAMSAGGHFNPGGKPHGDPASPDHHAGDLPQLMADANGNATLPADLSGIALGDGANDIIGKAVVVHKDADDFKTQPAGNSGARIACGVITKP